LGSTACIWHPVYRAVVAPSYRVLKWAGLLGPYLVTEDDCRRFGLSAHDLCGRGILEPSGYHGHFSFCQGRRIVRLHAPEALPLYWRTWHPLFKIRRFWSARTAARSGSGPDRLP
jgi:hypothetical protein